jgi:hypothetical protein
LSGRVTVEAMRDPVTGKEVASMWTDLGSEDAATAFRAVQRLSNSPGKALPLLKGNRRPLSAMEAKEVERLIAELDSDEFATRSRAAKELAKISAAAEPQLRQALKGSPSPEVRRQLGELLRQFNGWSAERLQVAGALEVLERMGTPPAREVLEGLAGGAPGAWQTKEARAALQRLAL